MTRKGPLAKLRSRVAGRTAVLAVASLCIATAVHADIRAPRTNYERVVGANEQYLFVMRIRRADATPRTSVFLRRKDDSTVTRRLTGRQAHDTRTTRAPYARSGLYPNDGSTEALWHVDWYAHDVRLTPDGRYLARLGPWSSSADQLAVAFYDRGRLLREYRILDLIPEPDRLPRSVSHFQWRKGVAFHDARGLLRIETLDGQRIEFELSSGRIVSR